VQPIGRITHLVISPEGAQSIYYAISNFALSGLTGFAFVRYTGLHPVLTYTTLSGLKAQIFRNRGVDKEIYHRTGGGPG